MWHVYTLNQFEGKKKTYFEENKCASVEIIGETSTGLETNTSSWFRPSFAEASVKHWVIPRPGRPRFIKS